MNREEQIDRSATQYAKVKTEVGIGIDATKYISFLAGARWADSHKKWTEDDVEKFATIFGRHRDEQFDIAFENILKDLNR